MRLINMKSGLLPILSVALSATSVVLLPVSEADESTSSFPHPVRDNTRIAEKMTDKTLIFIFIAPLLSRKMIC